MAAQALAHVRQSSDHRWIEHALIEHLNSVGAIASDFARSFGNSDWARVAGIWHDLGKYSAEFQTYIRKASGYQREEAHIEDAPGRVDHSTAGAIHAVSSFGPRGRILAYVIAGHHAGLPDWFPGDGSGGCLDARLQQRSLLDHVHAAGVPAEILKLDPPTTAIRGGYEGFALWVRMLFSCLVDADFLDTETFMNSERAQARVSTPSMESLLKRFDEFMAVKFSAVEATALNQVRKAVLHQCRRKAEMPSGVFSLSVPTGGGKTLSSLNAGEGNGIGKFLDMFERRAEKGQCVNQPYLGCREFAAAFRLVDERAAITSPISEDRDMGWVLYDLDFTNMHSPSPRFFRARLALGVMNVPSWTSAEVRG